MSEAPKERKVGDQEALHHATEDTFTKLSAFLVGELQVAAEDYYLLEKMNLATSKKYSEMAYTAEQLTVFMKELREKYQSFQPFLEKIDQIELGVQNLEETVNQLDEYSKRLEAKFKQLDFI